MDNLRVQAEERAARYLLPDTIEGVLGEGKDGIVFHTSNRTAIKVYGSHHTFFNELEVYQRLASHGSMKYAVSLSRNGKDIQKTI